MNDIVMKGMLKMVKNFVTPDQIKSAAGSLIKSAMEYKSQIVLDPEAGETGVIAILYEFEAVAYVGLAIVNDENHMLRFESLRPLDALIETFINKL